LGLFFERDTFFWNRVFVLFLSTFAILHFPSIFYFLSLCTCLLFLSLAH
jgi:hypothetical protein